MPLLPIFTAHNRQVCEQRAFVLQAVGIASEIAAAAQEWSLLVEEIDVGAALEQLRRYEAENVSVSIAPTPLPMHAGAWIAPCAYMLILLSAGYAAAINLWDRDWFGVGALNGELLRHGQWWRAITALMLHADSAHLLGNLALGAFFIFLAGQLIGPGWALLHALLGGALGNFIDGVTMPSHRETIGASTLVFCVLGLVAALAWRYQARFHVRWAHRWAPIVGAVMLLSITGTAGEHTDVVAHVAGFGCGIALGIVDSRRLHATSERIAAQLLAMSTAALLVIVAWAVALQ